jgi:hypothetical protein
MARRIPPRKVTYFEPVVPRLARNTLATETLNQRLELYPPALVHRSG